MTLLKSGGDFMLSEDLLCSNSMDFSIGECTYYEQVAMNQMHYHKHYEILYINHNERVLTIGGREYILNKDCVALIPHFIPHLTVPGEISPQKRILINFHESCIHKINQNLSLDLLSCFNANNPIVYINDFAEEFQRIIKLMFNKFTNNLDAYSRTEIILNLCNILVLMCKHSPSYDDRTSFQNIVRYVETHFNDPISLDILADRFYMSKYTISRKFSKFTGMSLPVYLNTIRVIDAKKRIAEGMKITEAAMECGYESVSNFDRVFRKEVGMTSVQYKKLNEKECK